MKHTFIRMAVLGALLALGHLLAASSWLPVEITDRMVLNTGDEDNALEIIYPHTDLPELNAVLDETLRQHFAELLQEKEQNDSFGYSIEYQARQVSSRLVVVSGFGSSWGLDSPTYQFMGSIFIWDQQSGGLLSIFDLFENSDCLDRIKTVSIVRKKGTEPEEYDLPEHTSLPGIMLPAEGGFLLCLEYSGLGGYNCHLSPLDSFDRLCPVKREYWK